MTPDPFIEDDAAYVLGALDTSERARFEQHLPTCADCRARVDALRTTMAALDGIGPEAVTGPDEPLPDTVYASMARAVRAQRRRRRGLVSGLAAVAAACLVALAVIAVRTGGSGPAGRPMTAVALSPVRATAIVQAETWGTRITLDCRYASDVHPAEAYGLVVVDRSGVAHPAGSWTLAPGGSTHFTGGIALPAAQIAAIEVTYGDTPVLRLAT